MAVFYSFLGLLLQGILVNLLFALTPAEGQNLRDVKVSVKAVDITLGQALQIIEQKTKFRFLYNDEQMPLNEKISAIADDESLYNILEVFAKDYGLLFNRINDQIVVRTSYGQKGDVVTTIETGSIKGKALDASTNKGIPGVNLLITGLNIGAAADANGNFYIANVPSGKHKLRISAVGYGKVLKDVTVQAGKQTEVDFFLDEEAVGLDEMVITGVAFEARRKEIPADIAVLTAKQIEEKHTSNFTDLLKGEIPGVFALSQGQFDDVSYIYIRGSGFLSEDYAKIYIDGVELADVTLLSTINLQSIERIEVIRGVQAAALYGAEATGGVIQIITKKGSGVNLLKIDAKASSGYIESKYKPSGATPIKTDNSVQISGGKETASYNIGVVYNTVGEWTKNYRTNTLSASGGARFVQEPVIANLTALWSKRDGSQATQDYAYERWPGLAPVGYRPGMVFPDYETSFNQATLGLNIIYQATPGWMHNLILGQDVNQYDYHQINPHYLTQSDTTQVIFNSTSSRQTLRYNTAYRMKIGELFSVGLTAGGEYSLYNSSLGSALGIKLNEFGDIKSEPSGIRSFSSTKRWTSGYSGMLEMGYNEKLFFTTSMAAKTDPRGAKKTYIVPPRFGLTYADDIGEVNVRLRGEYGTSVKPVNPIYATGSVSSTVIYLPNPDILPEKREGWDAGIETYWQNNASISITRFREEGKDAIMVSDLGVIDGIQTYQHINIGLISIAGYEVQAKLNFIMMGVPIILNANYTYSDNVIRELSNQYMPGPTQMYEIGDRVNSVPKYAGGGGLTMRLLQGSIGVYWQFSGGGRGVDYNAWYDYRYGTALHRDVGLPYSTIPSTVPINGVYVSKKSITRSYRVEYPIDWKFNFRAEQELTKGVNIFLDGTNLFNDWGADLNNTYAVPGRTTVLGVRVSY